MVAPAGPRRKTSWARESATRAPALFGSRRPLHRPALKRRLDRRGDGGATTSTTVSACRRSESDFREARRTGDEVVQTTDNQGLVGRWAREPARRGRRLAENLTAHASSARISKRKRGVRSRHPRAPRAPPRRRGTLFVESLESARRSGRPLEHRLNCLRGLGCVAVAGRDSSKRRRDSRLQPRCGAADRRGGTAYAKKKRTTSRCGGSQHRLEQPAIAAASAAGARAERGRRGVVRARDSRRNATPHHSDRGQR